LEVRAGGNSTWLKPVVFELETGTATVTGNWPVALVDSDVATNALRRYLANVSNLVSWMPVSWESDGCLLSRSFILQTISSPTALEISDCQKKESLWPGDFKTNDLPDRSAARCSRMTPLVSRPELKTGIRSVMPASVTKVSCISELRSILKLKYPLFHTHPKT
jgi:hypothetical protein